MVRRDTLLQLTIAAVCKGTAKSNASVSAAHRCHLVESAAGRTINC